MRSWQKLSSAFTAFALCSAMLAISGCNLAVFSEGVTIQGKVVDKNGQPVRDFSLGTVCYEITLDTGEYIGECSEVSLDSQGEFEIAFIVNDQRIEIKSYNITLTLGEQRLQGVVEGMTTMEGHTGTKVKSGVLQVNFVLDSMSST